MPELLALDFDGVISDSAPESFVVALLTYTDLISDSAFLERRAKLEAERMPETGHITADPLYERFLELMPLGNRAEDFAVSLSALEARTSLPDQAAYDAFRSQLDEAWLRNFHLRFYENRIRLSTRPLARSNVARPSERPAAGSSRWGGRPPGRGGSTAGCPRNPTRCRSSE